MAETVEKIKVVQRHAFLGGVFGLRAGSLRLGFCTSGFGGECLRL